MKHIFKIVIILVFLLSLPFISAIGKDKKDFSNDKINIEWVVSETDIEFSLSAETLGWIAIGFEPSVMMKDADIIIGYVHEGQLYIEDHYGSGYTSHKSDIKLEGTDNVTAISGEEVEGYTTIKFSIPLNSGDIYDKVLEPGRPYKVIFAYGRKDDFKSIHSYRTSAEIVF